MAFYSNLTLCQLSQSSGVESLQGAPGSADDLTYQNRFQLWKKGFDDEVSKCSESAIDDSNADAGRSNIITAQKFGNSNNNSLQQAATLRTTSLVTNCNETTTTPPGPSASCNKHGPAVPEQVQAFGHKSETLAESRTITDADARTERSEELELTVAIPAYGHEAQGTTLERMMIEFNRYGSMGALFRNDASVWDSDEGGLQRYLTRIGGKICKQFRPSETVQKMFENFVDIHISASLSANNLRKKKRKSIEDIVEARFRKIQQEFSFDWIQKNWAGTDLEEGQVNDSFCDLTLIKSFGKEWENYYKMRNRDRMGPYYKIVEHMKKYQTKLKSLLDGVVCCEETELLSSYHEEAYKLINFLHQDQEIGFLKLSPQIDQIMNTIRESVRMINFERVENEVKLVQRAIRYALTKYCQIMSSNLVHAVPHIELKNLHDQTSGKIVQSFYGVQGFKYTSVWESKQTLLMETLKREYLEFTRGNNTNSRLENIEIENTMQNYVTSFRHSAIELLSEDGDERQLTNLLTKTFSDMSTAIKIRYPSKAQEIMDRLHSRLLDVKNTLARNDNSITLIARGFNSTPKSAAGYAKMNQSPPVKDQNPTQINRSSVTSVIQQTTVAATVIVKLESSSILRSSSSLNIPCDLETVDRATNLGGKPEKNVARKLLTPQAPGSETRLRSLRSQSVGVTPQAPVSQASPASKPAGECVRNRVYDSARVILHPLCKSCLPQIVSGSSCKLTPECIQSAKADAPPHVFTKDPICAQESFDGKENNSKCNQVIQEPELEKCDKTGPDTVSVPTFSSISNIAGAAEEEPSPLPEKIPSPVFKRNLRSSKLHTGLDQLSESEPTRESTSCQAAPTTPTRFSRRIIKIETSLSPIATTGVSIMDTAEPVHASAKSQSPRKLAQSKYGRSTKLKLPSSHGVGIFFCETKIYIAVTVRKTVQSFTLPSKLRLLHSQNQVPKLISDNEADGPCTASLDIYLFLTEPEYVMTEEKFTSGESGLKRLWTEEVLAIFMHKVVNEIQTRWSKDITSDFITIGLPTFVSSRCKQRLKTALSLAGLHKSYFVQATTGISVSYLRSPVTSDEHYCLVVYIEDILQNVALLKVQDGRSMVIATEGSVSYKSDAAVAILNNISLAISSVVSAAGIKNQAIKHCVCVIEVDERNCDTTTGEDIIKTSWAAEKMKTDLPRNCKLEILNVTEGLLGGLAEISESFGSSHALYNRFTEVFPYTLEIKRVTNATNGTLKIVKKNGDSNTVNVNITALNLGTEETRSAIYCRHYDHKTKEVELFASANLREKDPNAIVKVTVNREGIISTGIETTNSSIVDSDWRRDARPYRMPLTDLESAKKRFKAIVSATMDRNHRSPPVKKIKWSDS